MPAAGDVELVARATSERPPRVRPDLGLDAEAADEPDGPARDGRLGEVEVDRELAVPAQVQAAGRVEEPGELGEPVAVVA